MWEHDHVSCAAMGIIFILNLLKINKLDNVIVKKYSLWCSLTAEAILSSMLNFTKICLLIYCVLFTTNKNILN